MGSSQRLYEVGSCEVDGRQILTVRMTRGSLDVWEVEVTETGSSRRIATRHENELDARRAIEVVYQYGRQFGQWRIERRSDYTPNNSAGPVSPAGFKPGQPSKA